MEVGIIGFIILVVAVWIYRDQTAKRNRKSFDQMVQSVQLLNSSRSAPSVPITVNEFDHARAALEKCHNPDLTFASKGFSSLALMRAYDIEVNLHDAERRLAEVELDKGCTNHQAMSMRWGGVQAIHSDLELYSAGVEAAKEVGSKEPYVDGARCYLATVLAQFPTEFQSFMEYMDEQQS